MYNNIDQVDLISNSICDLKCQFCFLHKNKFFQKYNTIVQNAWKDGTYVKNIKNFFKKTGADPSKVKTLELWGGEPYLTLKNLIPAIGEIAAFFPNITTYVGPTNGFHTNVKDLCNFIYEIDKNLTPREEDNLFHFHLQLSIDGMPNSIIMKEGHNASWDLYKQNFDNLCKEIDNYTLKNTSVDIVFLGNASYQNWIKSFKTYEDLAELIHFWDKVHNYIKEKIKTVKNEILYEGLTNIPKIALPHNLSVEESFDVTKMVKLDEYVMYQEKANRKYNQFIDSEFFCSNSIFFYNLQNQECPEANQCSITLLPDGTIPFCPCAYLQHYPEYRNEILEKEGNNAYKNALIYSKYFFNYLTATEEEIKKHQWYMLGGGVKDTFFPYIYYSYNLAKELALSRQIDYNYFLDSRTLYEEMCSSSTIGECRRENLNYTHIPYLTDENLIRAWYNGYVKYFKELNTNKIKLILETGLKDE